MLTWIEPRYRNVMLWDVPAGIAFEAGREGLLDWVPWSNESKACGATRNRRQTRPRR